MTKQAILEKALSLPRQDRAELIDQLLLSLDQDVDPGVEKAIADEVERRIDAVERGEMGTMSEKEFFDQLKSN